MILKNPVKSKWSKKEGEAEMKPEVGLSFLLSLSHNGMVDQLHSFDNKLQKEDWQKQHHMTHKEDTPLLSLYCKLHMLSPIGYFQKYTQRIPIPMMKKLGCSKENHTSHMRQLSQCF
jgi:hypothetical protein